MSMPKIPKQKHRPSLEDTVIDLLDSIALEEIALSHLINAEAEKVQAFIGKNFDFPTKPTNEGIIEFNSSINQMMNTVIMKEWLLLKKLENVKSIKIPSKHKKKKHIQYRLCKDQDFKS